jgi:hypothetical protein
MVLVETLTYDLEVEAPGAHIAGHRLSGDRSRPSEKAAQPPKHRSELSRPPITSSITRRVDFRPRGSS